MQLNKKSAGRAGALFSIFSPTNEKRSLIMECFCSLMEVFRGAEAVMAAEFAEWHRAL